MKDSVFDPETSEKTVFYYKGRDNKSRYKVWIYLEGVYLFYVDYVTYVLHPTFEKPIRKVQRTYSNANCNLIIWTWGVFEVDIKIKLKTGEIVSLTHRLSFDKQLQDSNIKYINTRNVT